MKKLIFKRYEWKKILFLYQCEFSSKDGEKFIKDYQIDNLNTSELFEIIEKDDDTFEVMMKYPNSEKKEEKNLFDLLKEYLTEKAWARGGEEQEREEESYENEFEIVK
jgi:hypothetical protein